MDAWLVHPVLLHFTPTPRSQPAPPELESVPTSSELPGFPLCISCQAGSFAETTFPPSSPFSTLFLLLELFWEKVSFPCLGKFLQGFCVNTEALETQSSLQLSL